MNIRNRNRAGTAIASWSSLMIALFALGGAGCSEAEGGAEAQDVIEDSDSPDSGEDAPSDVTGDLSDDVEGGDADTDADVEPPIDSLLLSDQFLNIAHRGGARLAPEETMVAYQNAVAVGADVLEIDLHATSDGVVVCMHDETVDRTTNGEGTIRGMTFDELRALDAGYHWTDDGGESYPYRGQGLQVPTAREVLEAFPEMHFAIEIKQQQPSIAADVVALIEELELDTQVVVASFGDAAIAEVRELNPRLITAFSLSEMIELFLLNPNNIGTYEAPGEIMQVPPAQGNIDALSPEILGMADEAGLRVQVWTINDRQEMIDIMALGVDGIFTDDPALLEEIISTGD